MGILSKGLTKLLKPEPSELPFSRRKDVGPLGGPSKKVTNPITKPRVYTQKAQVRDAVYETAHEFEYSDLDSDELYDLTAKERQEAPIPRKIGEFYSPVKDTIEQMPIAKEGSTGQTIEAFINKRSPNITKSELANAQIKLDPNKKYLREEVLALQNIPEGYDIRVRELREKNTIFHKTQRQRVLDAPRNYFEVTVHTPKVEEDVEDIVKDHFPIGVVAHVRASRRQGEDGKDYILVEEIQSDAARASGITEPVDYDIFYDPDINRELSNDLDTFMGDIIIDDDDTLAGTLDKYKIERGTDNPDIEEEIIDLEENLLEYSKSSQNPYNYVTVPFYEEVHKRFNTPNFEFDSMMLAYDNTNYGNIREADKALDLDIQGEDIPSTYRLSQIKIAENLVEEYKRGYKSLRNDPKFDVENYIDKTDKQNQKLVEDGIRKIHAYAIENHARSHILGLPYDLDMLYSVLQYKGDPSTGRLEGINAQAIEQRLKKIEENLYTKSPANEPQPPPGPEEPIFEKYKTPITTKTETMLKGLKASIALAKEQGLDKIVIPSYRMIGRERGNEEGFKDLYDKAFKKAVNVLQKESKGTIKLNTIKLKHAKPDEDVSSYLDEMPHYGGADFDEDFASELDISNFEFDPEKQTFRFSKGGTLLDDQMELFNEGGLRDEGGQVEPESGNKVPSGSLKEEVADDIPVMMSEGEFVFPADVVRYIGLETLMKMRQDAKQGLKMMEEMGQMGNSEEATIPDDVPFEMADLIVVSGSKPKKMQTGGLLDDPRFQRPTGGETPTMTDEDKKEIEDALLKTGFGRVVMKRYVDADGNVKYIPFIDDEPQMEIPEGFELDNSAPTPPTSSGTGTAMGDSGSDDSSKINPETGLVMTAMERDRLQLEGQSTGADAGFRDEEGNLIIHVGKDGTQYTNLEKMSAEDLVGYYETFNSKLNRFAAPLASVFFGPVAGSIIAVAQSVNNKYGANGLAEVEKEIRRRSGGFTAKHRDRLRIASEGIRKYGAGGYQGIIKPFTTLLGGNKELSDFEKYLDENKGDFKGAINKLNKTTTDTSNNTSNKNVNDYQATFKDIDDFLGSDDIISTPMDYKSGSPFPNYEVDDLYSMPPADTGVGTEDEYIDYGYGNLGLPVEETTVERETVVRDPRDISDRPFVTREDQIAYEATYNALKKAGSSDKDAGDLASDVVENLQKDSRTKKRLGKLDSFGTDYGVGRVEKILDKLTPEPKPEPKPVVVDQRPPSDIDYSGYQSEPTDRPEDSGGDQDSSDDFFSYRPNPQSTYTTTYNPPAPTGRSPGFPGVSTPSFGGGYSAPPTYDYGGVGPFYVGGVATKPMKPQRLKKGGLAKPKVKPKRMKKGGLASRKK